MAFEQEPIKIEVVAEEDEVLYLPEQGGRDVAQRVAAGGQRVAAGGQRVAAGAREAWDSERRRQVQAGVARGARVGARASRWGLVRGLHWLSRRLAGLAERFTPVE